MRLSDAHRKDLPEKKDSTAGDKTAGRARARTKGGKADDVGRALRSAYDAALSEDIPTDFLDLLGKLD